MEIKGITGRDLHDKIRELKIFLNVAVDNNKRKELEKKIEELRDKIKDESLKEEVL